jgi:cathepsin B
MRLSVCVAVLCCAAAVSAMVDLSAPVLDDKMIAHVNSMNWNGEAGWTAARNSKFESLTIAQAKRLLGAKLLKKEDARPYAMTAEAEAIPAAFDARTQWGACIGAIRNQEQCGSCWAFGATESFSDRVCIASKAAANVPLSPEDLVSCDTTNYGCEGGYLLAAWQFMSSTGVVTDACFPYTAGGGTAPACAKKCKNGASWTPVKVSASSIIQPATVASIQTAIMTNGPVEVAFTVYQDFMSYESGVYVHTSGSELGGHAVKAVGWGVSGSTPYWIIANSWGTSWGQLGGFFWIKRGVDECGIESNVVAGLPA